MMEIIKLLTFSLECKREEKKKRMGVYCDHVDGTRTLLMTSCLGLPLESLTLIEIVASVRLRYNIFFLDIDSLKHSNTLINHV